MSAVDEDYDDIEKLIDTDPIELGLQFRILRTAARAFVEAYENDEITDAEHDERWQRLRSVVIGSN